MKVTSDHAKTTMVHGLQLLNHSQNVANNEPMEESKVANGRGRHPVQRRRGLGAPQVMIHRDNRQGTDEVQWRELVARQGIQQVRIREWLLLLVQRERLLQVPQQTRGGLRNHLHPNPLKIPQGAMDEVHEEFPLGCQDEHQLKDH